MRIPLASSGLRQVDIEIATNVLNSGNLTMGSQVKLFESTMASYLGSKEFVMMNSGSSANLAMIEALMRPAKSKPKLYVGDGVLVPAIAWPTTIWPIIQLGLKPYFVDVEQKTLAMDLIKAQSLINASKGLIKAMFPIHPLGYAIPPSELEAFALRNELILINDVCESLGSWSGNKHAGTSGIAGSFSFYFSHHITTMEGGGVATDDPNFADDLRSIRSHGWSRDRKDVDDWHEKVSDNDAKFLFVSTGYNIRPMEIQAAIGISQMKDIDKFIVKRRAIAMAVKKALAGTIINVIDGGTSDSEENYRGHSWMLIALQVTSVNPTQVKKLVVADLEKFEIETRPPLTGNFLSQPAMRRVDGVFQTPESFDVAISLTNTTFLIGAHHDLTPNQVEYLCEKLAFVAKKYK